MALVNEKPYRISYAPPVQVKDEPHRVFDTLNPERDCLNITSDDYGSVSIEGTSIEIKPCEVASEEPAKRVIRR